MNIVSAVSEATGRTYSLTIELTDGDLLDLHREHIHLLAAMASDHRPGESNFRILAPKIRKFVLDLVDPRGIETRRARGW